MLLFLCLPRLQSLGWDRLLTWAWGFHYELGVGQALKIHRKKSAELTLWPYTVAERTKGKDKKRYWRWNSLGWELLSSRCDRARQEPNLLSAKYCFLTLQEQVGRETASSHLTAVFGTRLHCKFWMLLALVAIWSISKGKIHVRRTDAIVMTTKSRESLSGQLLSRLLTFM